MLSNRIFYHRQSRALFSAYKIIGVAQSILENFGFHNEYDHEYEKVFTIFWTLQINFWDPAHVEWLLGPCRKKVAAACHKWTRWIKVVTHLNIDKFVLNVPAVAVVVIRARFSSLYVVK